MGSSESSFENDSHLGHVSHWCAIASCQRPVNSPQRRTKEPQQREKARSIPSRESSKYTDTLPVWKKDPDPLPGWSANEQKVILEAAKNLSPFAKNEAEERRNLWGNLSRTHGPLGQHTVDECEACYQYVLRMRVAFFG